MTQYDAGPGDWSDREWEAPTRKRQPHAKKKGVELPPWALIAGAVAAVALLCAGLIIVGRAIFGDGSEAKATETAVAGGQRPVATDALGLPTQASAVSPTATVVIPVGITDLVPTYTEVGIGAPVVVKGTGGAGLNLREEPSQSAQVVVTVKEGAALTVIEGPGGSADFPWWKVRTVDGKEGWGAARYLALREGE